MVRSKAMLLKPNRPIQSGTESSSDPDSYTEPEFCKTVKKPV